jgi:hypothetical protein
MRLFAFWPILILLTVPNTVILYWEHGMPEYADRKQCEAKLEALEQMARLDVPFLVGARSLNGGVMPVLTFSQECIDQLPTDYARGVARQPRPDERS